MASRSRKTLWKRLYELEIPVSDVRHIASIADFKAAGAKSPNCAHQECIGRYTGKGSPKEGDSSGCNWAAYGLFGIPNGKGVFVMTGNEEGQEIFDYAPAQGEKE